MAQITEQFINQVKEVVKKQPIPPQYNPAEWEKKKFNCYAYAMRICIDLSSYDWICPGFISKGANNDYQDTKESIIEHFKEDCQCLGLKVLPTTISAKIKKNKYKIAVYVKEGEDFHFARQDSNGNWSEKNGWYDDIKILNEENVSEIEDGYEFIGVFMVSKK